MSEKSLIRSPPSPYHGNPIIGQEEYKWDPKIDWYLFENHIRDIVKNILYPYQIKSDDTNEYIKEVRSAHNNFKRRLEEMEFVVRKS